MTPQRKLKIDPQFCNLLPKLTDEDRAQLEQNLVDDGAVLNPVIVWAGSDFVIDGHNRYDVAQKYGLSYDVVELPFEDRDEVIAWIYRHAIGQRNMKPLEVSYCRGQAVNYAKGQQRGRKRLEGGNLNAQNGGNLGQNDLNGTKQGGGNPPESDELQSKTDIIEELAQETGVSVSTVKRDSVFARQVDELIEPLQDKAKGGEINKKQTAKLAGLSDTAQNAAYRAVRTGQAEDWDEALGLNQEPEPEEVFQKKKKGLIKSIENMPGVLDELNNINPSPQRDAVQEALQRAVDALKSW